MAGRASSAARADKVPCENPTICGSTRKSPKHIRGTMTQRRCAEITRRRKNGEEITPEMASLIRPAPLDGADADPVRAEMERLREAADAWRDDPGKVLDFVSWSARMGLTPVSEYSPGNRTWLFLQNPNVSQVAGARKWEELGRTLKEDAAALHIYAPAQNTQVPERDESGEIKLDSNGKPKMRRVFVSRFRPIEVYDISDTVGDTVPETEPIVADRAALTKLANELAGRYDVSASPQPMVGDVPARLTGDGVVYNSLSTDPDTQAANHLIGAAMAVSKHIRDGQIAERRTKTDGWGHAEHLYAGVAAAHALGREVGLNLDDAAAVAMSRFPDAATASQLASHAAGIISHIALVRQEMPVDLADAFHGF